MCKCEIMWVDPAGDPTPDDNRAVGYCYREAFSDPPTKDYPSGVHFPKSRKYYICARHYLRLDSYPHWIFVPINEEKT